MKRRESIRDIMFENIQADHNEEIIQGNKLKEISDSKIRQEEYVHNAYIYGTLYYTEERIKQIKDDANKYLHIEIDINFEEIKVKTSDNSHLDIGKLEQLYDIENKISEVKQKLDIDCNASLKKDSFIYSMMIGFADWFNGGGNNEN